MPNRRILFSFFLFCAMPVLAASRPSIDSSFARTPLSFETNLGQADGSVRFLARGDGQVLYLTPSEAVVVVQDAKGRAALRMSFAGSRSNPQVDGLDVLPGKTNFLRGNHPSQWRTNVPNYRRVIYRGVYPGVDLVFHGDRSQLEYDIVVAPGADSSRVRLSFSGARKLTVNSAGDLVFHLEGDRTVRQRRPDVYQDSESGRRTIAGRYRLLGKRHGNFEVAFELRPYDPQRSLVIDPVMSFSTYFGGVNARSQNQAWAVAVDRDGNVYIAGDADATDLPTTTGSFQPTSQGGDVFVTKLDASGSTILYCTYVGGASSESARGIAVDAAGNAYVTGETRSANFPTVRPFQATHGGGLFDAFLFKLNPSGTALVYSTYLGGSADDHAYGVAVDSASAAYVAGSTISTNFPVRNAVQSSLAPNTPTSPRDDVFISKFAPDGASLVYSTYYGGSGSERANAIAVDPAQAAYITGRTDTAFPITTGTFQSSSHTCSGDAFVLKLSGSGTVVYAACLGGSGADEGYAIAADASGNAYVAGGTTSGSVSTATGFPLASPLSLAVGGEDVFVTKINPAGSALIFSTLLGGTIADRAYGVALDSFNNIFVTGFTGSANFPTVNALQVTPGAPFNRGFVAKYKADGTALLWSTYLGGMGTHVDDARAIASDASGNVYITGLTGSNDFPTTANALQTSPSVNGASQSFVTRIGETPVISPNGLLGGATFGAGFTPGAILSLFGTYLGASTGSAAAVPLPTKISGATVKVNGVAAPLYYVSPTQINFQLPYDVSGSSAQVTVTLANLTSAPATINIAAAAPGIFTTNSSGKGQGVVLIYPNNEIAGPTGSIPGAAVRPIKKGEFAIIYASGLGAVNNGPKSGEPSPANPATTVLPVTVTIGGVTVPADFAGLVPGFVGLYQVNVPIPAGAQVGDAVNLSVSVGGTPSNTVTIAIQ